MRPRKNNLETVAFTLEILRRIPRGQLVTAQAMHDQLSASGIQRDLRSVQRQLNALCEHFEIEKDARSKPHGYRWKGDARGLGALQLSPQESLLLNLAEAHLKHLLPASVLTSLEGFFSEARRNLQAGGTPPNLETQWRRKVRVVSTSQPLLPAKLDRAVFSAVSEALYKNRYLDLTYMNSAGETTDSRVMPLGLAQQGPRVYLVCQFEKYTNKRILALHRIRTAKVVDISFVYPADFDLKRYEDDANFGFGDGKRVRLSFQLSHAAAQHLTETPLSSDQVMERRDKNWMKVSATVVDSAMLNRWLAGFENDIRAIRKVDAVQEASDDA